MFHSICFLVLFALGASMAVFQNPCTTVKYPADAVLRGSKLVMVKPIVLRPNVRRYTLDLENNCLKTRALVLRVCDYDVRPYVSPVSFTEVFVARSGGARDVGMAFPEYYCDY